MHVSEYYDLFEFNKSNGGDVSSGLNHYEKDQNAAIIPTNQTNPFAGFWNDNNFTAGNPNNTDIVQGKSFSSLAYNSVYVEDDGTINCMPPTVSVPYWSKIIFRNFDYNFNNLDGVSKFTTQFGNITTGGFNYSNTTLPLIVTGEVTSPVPEFVDVVYTENDQNYFSGWVAGTSQRYKLWDTNTADYMRGVGPFYPDNFPSLFKNKDFRGVEGTETTIDGAFEMTNFDKMPLFLKFDEYPSQSKVIFSRCDKTRNPDIEFNFNNQHGQSEPVKLYLSLSASKSGYDATTNRRFNTKLTKAELKKLLNSCYWCIEWVYVPEKGN